VEEETGGIASGPEEEAFPKNLIPYRQITLRHSLQLLAQGDREFAVC
jgi:hypothetical protein